MAVFRAKKKPGHTAWLEAYVEICSAYTWRLDILEQRLSCVLGLESVCRQLRVEFTSAEDASDADPFYCVYWQFELGHTDVAQENEERLEAQTQAVLAVFDKMEKYANCLKRPLIWLVGDGISNEKREQDSVCECGGKIVWIADLPGKAYCWDCGKDYGELDERSV